MTTSSGYERVRDIARSYPKADNADLRAIIRTASFLGEHTQMTDGVGCACGWRRQNRGVDWAVHVAAELLTTPPWETSAP